VRERERMRGTEGEGRSYVSLSLSPRRVSQTSRRSPRKNFHSYEKNCTETIIVRSPFFKVNLEINLSLNTSRRPLYKLITIYKP